MADGKKPGLSGLRAWIVALATVASAIIAYLAWAHPKNGQQTFSVAVSASPNAITGATVGKEKTIDFKVKKCEVATKRVSCSLSVRSSGYDRRLTIDPYGSHLVDDDGDTFKLSGGLIQSGLERDQELPFKLSFDVNKNYTSSGANYYERSNRQQFLREKL